MRESIVLSSLLALLAGALLGCGGAGPSAATKEDPCSEGFTACDELCVDLLRHPENCGACGIVCDGVCVDGTCQLDCRDGALECEGTCVDPLSDAENCGACGVRCGEGEICAAGACACDEGRERCDGACVDTASDAENCGACGQACEAGRVCVEGSCACPEGHLACDGACIDPLADDENCGACGEACGEDRACVQGACALDCPEGLLACEERCVDPLSDLAHCGGCGAACFEGQRCVEGACRCDEGRAACGDTCVDLGSDPAHCGGCDEACFEGQLCHEGACICSGLAEACEGACVDTSRSREHCGSCGNLCLQRANAEPPACVAGACLLVCDAGYDDCDGDPVNGCEVSLPDDPAHCGTCGKGCAALPNVTNAGCAEGVCTFECLPGFADCDGDPENGCEASLASPTSCGSCATDCTQLPKVQAASCVDDGGAPACDFDGCEDGWMDCDTDPATGCEASVLGVNSCRGCNVSCAFACGPSGCTTADTVHATMGGNACAILGDGSLWCWGAGDAGKLGYGVGDRDQPVHIPLPAAAEEVAGTSHLCARLADGTVACWGENGDGQLGDGTTASRPTPAPIPQLANVTAIGAGMAHSCALTSDGEVYCWGSNAQGQLGLDPATTPSSATPVQVPDVAGVASLAVGWDANCGLLADGTLRCWGANHFGQLGNGVMTASEAPLDPGFTDVVSVSIGFAHTCSVDSDGIVECWGWNQFGQIGTAPTIPIFWELAPLVVPGVAGAATVELGYGHGCAQLQNGDIVCWGSNFSGEIGDGASGGFEVPPTLVSLSDVSEVSLGQHTTCARLDTGFVECWGQNDRGQLGNGDQPNLSPLPTPVLFP